VTADLELNLSHVKNQFASGMRGPTGENVKYRLWKDLDLMMLATIFVCEVDHVILIATMPLTVMSLKLNHAIAPHCRRSLHQ
jgi:hypothetical protein